MATIQNQFVEITGERLPLEQALIISPTFGLQPPLLQRRSSNAGLATLSQNESYNIPSNVHSLASISTRPLNRAIINASTCASAFARIARSAKLNFKLIPER
jgi:hypothetical protein